MPLGPTSKARLTDCHPKLRRLVEAVSERLDRTRKYDLTVTCGHRGQADQEAAFSAHPQRSTKHWPDSRHNTLPSTAVDLAPYPTDWNDAEAFAHLAGYVQAVADDLDLDIEWGGDWTSLVDRPHFQLSAKELNRP